MLVIGFAGCGDGETECNGSEPGTIIAGNDKSITIVDQALREVTVSKYPSEYCPLLSCGCQISHPLDQGNGNYRHGKDGKIFLRKYSRL